MFSLYKLDILYFFVNQKNRLFDQMKLQAYILLCQEPTDGGLFDKPGKFPDLYHTCYSLSGLNSA